MVVALCWHQKCFKWAIFWKKNLTRKKHFIISKLRTELVGPQDPHRWSTWNRRTCCWVEVLDPGLCSPPSPTASRHPLQFWNINLTCFLFFSIFHYFSLPQQRVRLFHVNHRPGGSRVVRFWHSLTWNRSTIIWAPKQLPFFPDLGLLHFLEMLLNHWFWWLLPFVDTKNASNEQFFEKRIVPEKKLHHLQIQDWAVGPQDPHRWLTWTRRIHCPNRWEHFYCNPWFLNWIWIYCYLMLFTYYCISCSQVLVVSMCCPDSGTR